MDGMCKKPKRLGVSLVFLIKNGIVKMFLKTLGRKKTNRKIATLSLPN